MEDNVFDKIHEVDLKDTMEESYINYAMSVIASRALPDVRDGLKPVQRRILYYKSEQDVFGEIENEKNFSFDKLMMLLALSSVASKAAL